MLISFRFLFFKNNRVINKIIKYNNNSNINIKLNFIHSKNVDIQNKYYPYKNSNSRNSNSRITNSSNISLSNEPTTKKEVVKYPEKYNFLQLRNAILSKRLKLAWEIYSDKKNREGLLYVDYCDLIKLLRFGENTYMYDIRERLKRMEQVKDDVIELKMAHDIDIYDVIIKTYLKIGDFEGVKKTWKLVLEQNENFPRDVIPSKDTFNTMIESILQEEGSIASVLTKNEVVIEHLKKFHEFCRKKKFKMNEDVYITFIIAFADLGVVEYSEKLFDEYLYEKEKMSVKEISSKVCDVIISQYLRDSLFNLNRANGLYDKIVFKGIRPMKETFNRLIKAYFDSSEYKKAENFYENEYRKRNAGIDVTTINIMILGCLKAIEQHFDNTEHHESVFVHRNVVNVNKYFQQGIKKKFIIEQATFDNLIRVFGKLGKFQEINYYFQQMKSFETKPNLPIYHTLIEIYGKGRKVSNIMRLWYDLIDNMNPTIDTLKIFIKSMISSNEPKLGMDFMEEAKERFGENWNNYEVLNEIEKEFKEQFEKDKYLAESFYELEKLLEIK
ncbi:4886_t:CDS:1 [Entrophospora sp. SA101]|nr:6729_t:CDS:1 [Entrophospora sp. SA101]CAJ0637159.1 3561_t:CDS:1 [Entrophospora sp. SA101]CAJ0756961.1 7642_t:CDS:1 [Entrophospora sp. SA101]CAJ0764580.1 4886_t:CDS:1 [Entrophospora sp. SA101]CAJ0832128.1 610_t:CDS:1 [Entrophospora sp. SA101]